MKIITVWVTKYALSTGIEKLDVEYDEDKFPNMVRERPPKGFARHFHGQDKEWHLTEAGALKRAEVIRNKKIKTLHSQIDKLSKLTF